MPDLLCTEGLVDSGLIDFIWDDGWHPPTGHDLRLAQHGHHGHVPGWSAKGYSLPSRAVVVVFVRELPLALASIEKHCASGKYIVIVAPGDPSLNENGGPRCNVHRWPSFVHHVFGPSVIEKTPRFTPMPMAFHAFYEFSSQIDKTIAAIPKTYQLKRTVLVSFSLDTGSVYRDGHERISAIECFRSKPFATIPASLLGHADRTTRLAGWDYPEYLQQLRAHDYLVVPVGYGVERVAQWEAMSLGTIPICLKHPELLHFADMPIAFVDHWEDVTPTWCRQNIGLIARPTPKLRLSYWIEQIGLAKHKLCA